MQTSHKLEVKDIYTDEGYKAVSQAWNRSAWERKKFDQASWMGVKSKQLTPDIYQIQEIVSYAMPDIVIETGTGRGGTTLLVASLLFFLGGKKVITIDVPTTNPDTAKRRISGFPALCDMIAFIEGSSIEKDIINRVHAMVEVESHVLLLLDAGHTKDHVLQELRAYSSLLQSGDNIIVCDTNMPRLSTAPRGDERWKTNSAHSGVMTFLSENRNFMIDRTYDHWEITSFPDGILRCK